MDFQLGLCSVALRHLDPADVVMCAVAGGATGVEWEARVHVPAGDRDKARRAADLCKDAGLLLPSYGSYVRAGSSTARTDFAAALVSASELGVQHIRVWAGDAKDLSPSKRNSAAATVADDLGTMCDMAADAGMFVSMEFHPGTFTENATSALELIRRVDRPNLRSYWQPDYGQQIEDARGSLQYMLPVLSNIHVFHWTADHTRMPLSAGKSYWLSLLGLVHRSPVSAAPGFALLEFSQEDSFEQVVSDLQALERMLSLTANSTAGSNDIRR